ncbi:MAG: hypothetical protein JNL82_04330 [Myxococcales bacterium]|nr:hypothetical protein [Myxococcales bacterium]
MFFRDLGLTAASREAASDFFQILGGDLGRSHARRYQKRARVFHRPNALFSTDNFCRIRRRSIEIIGKIYRMNTRTDEHEDEFALDGRGVKLLLPGGALVVHMPTADGVVLLRDFHSAQTTIDTSIRIQYQDPGGGILRAFILPSLQSLLVALEQFVVEGARQ